MKYYRVKCKCGHVGRGKYIEIDFPIKAETGKQAAKVARDIPRVKHDRKDAILDTIEISYEEFVALAEKNDVDPYLQCENIQQQNKIDLLDRIKDEPEEKDYKNKPQDGRVVGKMKIRNYKKYYFLNMLFA